MNDGNDKILNIGGNICRKKPADAVAVKTSADNIGAIKSILLNIPEVTDVSVGAAGHIEVYGDSTQLLAGRIGDYLLRDESGYRFYEESNFLAQYDVFHNPERPTQPQEEDQ